VPRRSGPRPALRRAGAGLAVALIAFGIGMLLYPAATNLYTAREQARLRREFAASVRAAAAGPAGPVPAREAMAVIRIPAMGLDAVVVQGTGPQSLRTGPGHYAGTPSPCLPGNAAIAGHRTTYGHPFSRLDELVAGDDIVVTTPAGGCTYQVLPPPAGAATPDAASAAWIVRPDDWAVVGPLGPPGVADLTLTTCNPKGSAAQRLVVRARLVAAEPA
jgi:sortase A